MLKVAIGAILTVTVAGQVQAQNVNTAPPGAGYDVILDLAGIVHATPTATTGTAAGNYSQYTTTFTAYRSQSTTSFAFRNDAGYFALDNVSAVDTTTSSGNLLVNSGFETPGLVPAYFSPIPG